MTSELSQLCVAIVGYGSIGHRHAKNLARLGIGRPVIVRRGGQANPAFSPPREAVVVHSLDAALARQPDLAIIATPTGLHTRSARPLIEARVPILVEKPLSDDIESASELAELARQRRVWASMAYPLRYHGAYRMARGILKRGALGRLRRGRMWFESYLPDWHPWEDYRVSYAARPELGGGVLPTLDHEIDFLNWCFGEPSTVSGLVGRSGKLDAPIDDFARLVAIHPSGLRTALRLSLCHQDRRRGFQWAGDQGSLRYDWTAGRLEVAGRDNSPTEGETLWQDDGQATERMYRDMLTAMLRSVVHDEPPPTPLEVGLAALRFCRLARMSRRNSPSAKPDDSQLRVAAATASASYPNGQDRR